MKNGIGNTLFPDLEKLQASIEKLVSQFYMAKTLRVFRTRYGVNPT